MTRFLVLGATGMAGHTIATYLSEQGNDVTGFCRQPTQLFNKSIQGDALDLAGLEHILREGQYDVVVNCIGILNCDAENHKARAVYLNSYLPHALATMTKDMPTRIFHMSTDCVFAGNTGPYSENSRPDGLSFYDRSKALGEVSDEKNLTFRNSIVGPDLDPRGIGLLNWFMSQTGSVNGFERVMWTGLTTLELAKAMNAASESGATGLVNMVPNDAVSKYELLCLFNAHLRDSKVEVVPVCEPTIDKSLIRTNFCCPFQPAAYEQQVSEMADWIREHSNLYPHYGLE